MARESGDVLVAGREPVMCLWRGVPDFIQCPVELAPAAVPRPPLQVFARSKRGDLFGERCGYKLIDGDALFPSKLLRLLV